MGREVQRSAFDFDRSFSLLYPALFSCTKALAAVTAGSQTRLCTKANKKLPGGSKKPSGGVCDLPVVAKQTPSGRRPGSAQWLTKKALRRV